MIWGPFPNGGGGGWHSAWNARTSTIFDEMVYWRENSGNYNNIDVFPSILGHFVHVMQLGSVDIT